MWSVLWVSSLTQSRRYLSPVSYAVQKDMSHDLSLAARKRSRSARLEGQHRSQICFGGPSKISADRLSSSDSDAENLVERTGGKPVIRRGGLARQTLRVTQFYSKDVQDKPPNVVSAGNVEIYIQRIGVLAEKVLPPTGLRLGVEQQFLKVDPGPEGNFVISLLSGRSVPDSVSRLARYSARFQPPTPPKPVIC